MTPPKAPPASGDDKAPEKGTPRTPAAPSSAPRGPGAAGWSLVIVFVLLAIFYGWRTQSNRAQLTDRNLRELDRIGRTIEGRAGGYAMILKSLADRTPASVDSVVKKRLVLGLIARDSCGKPPELPDGLKVQGNTIHACYVVRPFARRTQGQQGPPGGPQRMAALFAVEPLRQALDTLLFDATFITAADSTVFLLSARGSGLRLRGIPPDSTKEKTRPASRVRAVTLGGHGYLMFLQPLAIQPVAAAGASPQDVQTWWVGGLVSTSRFRGESLALEPPHLVFLGLMVLLAVLSLPYLRVALMGTAESVRVSDVHLLSLALMLAGGVLGAAIADTYFSGAYSATLDRNLVAAADRLATAYTDEVRGALGEMEHWRLVFDTAQAGRKEPGDAKGILKGIGPKLDSLGSKQWPNFLRERYLAWQMIVWHSPEGEQKAKWTPRAENTARVPVRDRAYFSRIVGDSAFIWREGPRSFPAKYVVESINSLNTGEQQTAVSMPYCWSPWPPAAAPGGRADPGLGCKSLGAEVLFMHPLSLDRPVLPPGVQFAIVDRTGTTQFHSDPQRDLAENFLEETGRNPVLAAALATHQRDTLDADYMGRRTRLYIRPLEGTPYSLVLVLDKSLAGTVRFESVFTSLLIFFAFALLVWLLVIGVEHMLPGHLRWAWPDLGRPRKYMWLTGLLLTFALVLLTEAVGAATLRLPVHAGAFMVPLQALAVGLLVQSAGIGKWWSKPRRWTDPRAIGWGLLAFVTGVQVGTHLITWGEPGRRFDDVMGVLQFLAAAGAALVILHLPRSRKGEGSVARWYVTAGTCAVIVLATLPAYLLQQEAFAVHEERLVRYEQAQLLAQRRARTYRILARARENQLPPVADSLLLSQKLDQAVPPVYGARWDDTTDAGCAAAHSPLQHQVFSRVRQVVPFVTGAAVGMRDVGDSLGGRGWDRCADGLVRLAWSRDTVLRAGLAVGVRGLDLTWWLLLALLGAGGLGALWVLVRWVARRVFLLDLPGLAPMRLPDKHSSAATLVICTGAFRPEALQLPGSPVDLREVPHKRAKLAAALEPARNGDTLVLDHLDSGLDEPTWRAALLETLEEEVYERKRKVVLLTEREPGALFPLNDFSEAGPDDVTARWTRLLGQFVKISAAGVEPPARSDEAQRANAAPRQPLLQRWAAEILELSRGFRRTLGQLELLLERALASAGGGGQGAPGRDRRAEAAKAKLEEECPPQHARLTEIRDEIEHRYDVGALTEDGVLDQVRECADPYYRALWAGLEKDEKLIVAQLAENVVVNPESRRAVRRLLARGVLMRTPELRLMNQSFARFVQEEVPPAVIRAWENALPSSHWQRLRFPIILALAIVAAFLFATQRETFDTMLAIVTGVGLASTAVFRLVGGLTGGKSSG